MDEKDYVELLILRERVSRIKIVSKIGIIFSIASSIILVVFWALLKF